MKIETKLTYLIFVSILVQGSKADWLANIIALREGKLSGKLSEKIEKKIERKLQKAHQTLKLATDSAKSPIESSKVSTNILPGERANPVILV